MKKLLFTVILVIAANALYSQIYKGQWMVGGDGSFSSKKIKSAKAITEVSFQPNVGYFFMDKLAGGLRLNIDNVNDDNDGSSSTEIFGAAFVRYYFLPPAQKTNLLADVSYGVGHNSTKTGTNASTVSSTTNALRISAGPAFFLSPSVALEVTPYYRMSGPTDREDKTDAFGVLFGFQIHLGKAKSGTTTSTSATP